MPLILGFDSLSGVLQIKDAIDLLERLSEHEANGKTNSSSKFNSDFNNGSMRILFAVDYEKGYCATKAYHTVEGVGSRYIISLINVENGELLAVLDGRRITDLRTGAASGVIAKRINIPGPITAGIVGSGRQARAQLEALAAVYDLQNVFVYSPTIANRNKFSQEMKDKLGVDIHPVSSVEAAVTGRPVVATASNYRDTEPLVRGEWLEACRLLCAVGNTRAQYNELDEQCFINSQLTVVDTKHALQEAGELICAVKTGALPPSKSATLSQVVVGTIPIPAKGLVVFKSVGTALQDLSLAGRYYELLAHRTDLPLVTDLGSL